MFIQWVSFLIGEIIMNALFAGYLTLSFAIICELLGTSFLMKSEQFTKLLPSVFMFVFYVASFYFLSLALKNIPLGIAYALWGGIGIFATAVISVIVFKQTLDLPAIIGIVMILSGVIIMNVFSNTISH